MPRLFIPFATGDPQHSSLEVNILTGSGTQLAHADPGLQEDLQDRVVAPVGAGT